VAKDKCRQAKIKPPSTYGKNVLKGIKIRTIMRPHVST
jgi:hypothetical protein